MSHRVKAFFDEATNTVTYVVEEPHSRACVIIDPASGRTSTASADEVIEYLENNSLDVFWILETHVHADHLSGAAYLKSKVGGRTGVGKLITEVQSIFKGIFNLGDEFTADGEQFDALLIAGDMPPADDNGAGYLKLPVDAL